MCFTLCLFSPFCSKKTFFILNFFPSETIFCSALAVYLFWFFDFCDLLTFLLVYVNNHFYLYILLNFCLYDLFLNFSLLYLFTRVLFATKNSVSRLFSIFLTFYQKLFTFCFYLSLFLLFSFLLFVFFPFCLSTPVYFLNLFTVFISYKHFHLLENLLAFLLFSF